MEIKPLFTRYLYEFNQVMTSLQESILDKKKDESLFWTYELYHSGFELDAWYLLREIYSTFYAEHNYSFQMRLESSFGEWKITGDDLLIGTVAGTLAIMRSNLPDQIDRKNKFVVLYKTDIHKTQPVIGQPRHYLEQVSKYPIRILYDENDCEYRNTLKQVQKAYLDKDWLDYCTETPIWQERIQACRGKIQDNRVTFETDEDLEEFYERWGFEPDEQTSEMHQFHGILLDI